MLPNENGEYTVNYRFDDGMRGFDAGPTKEEAERRAKRVGEFEELPSTGP